MAPHTPHTLGSAPAKPWRSSTFRSFTLLALMALGLGVGVGPARVDATTVVPVSDAALVGGATAIVVARVTGVQSRQDPGSRQVVTDVSITVDEVLAGNVATRTLSVRVPGGRLPGVEMRVHGAPEFQVGERVALFLSAGRDGYLRVAHLSQGKWSVVVDGASGSELAVRIPTPGVRMLSPTAVSAAATRGPVDVRRLDDLRRLARQMRARERTTVVLAGAPAAVTTPVAQTSAAFTLLGAARWFEPDRGASIPVFWDPAGDPVAPGGGVFQVAEAAQAWSTIPGSAASLSVRAAAAPLGFGFDGTNAILLRDPSGVIDPPVGCTGTLAVTVVYATPAETTVVGGQRFARIIEADIVVADGWDGCDLYESHANLTEVIAHEMGHVLGFGHSADPSATMAPFAHFDGRGASPATLLENDDRAAALFLYPRWTRVSAGALDGGGTVSLAPAGVSCGADCVGYPPGTVVTATATPRPGYAFVEWAEGCGLAPTCTFTLTEFHRTLRARFSNVFTLAFAAPSAGDVRGLTTVALSASGGTGYSYRVSVDGALVYAGSSPSFAWDTTRYPDSERVLTATVTDALGRTATATQRVRIANGAAHVATLTNPMAGATVRGTSSVMMTTTAPSGEPKTFTLYADDVAIFGLTTTATSVQYRWNTTGTPNGAHRLRLHVSRGPQTATALRDVTVANGAVAPPPLTASFTAPAAGASVGRTATVRMSTGRASRPVTFALTIDGVEVSRQTVAGISASYAWDTTAVADGPHTVALSATDSLGRTVTVTRTVTVDNRITASFTAPASGAAVRRAVSVGMSTTAPLGRTKTFTLAIDGREVTAQTITGTTARYTFDTRTVPNGAHTLTLTVTWNGQTGTATRSIIVNN